VQSLLELGILSIAARSVVVAIRYERAFNIGI
jgi:hypothetical protein